MEGPPGPRSLETPARGPQMLTALRPASSCGQSAGCSGTRWSQWLVVSGKVNTVSSWHPAVAQDGRQERRASSAELPGCPLASAPSPPPRHLQCPLQGSWSQQSPLPPRAHLKGNSPPQLSSAQGENSQCSVVLGTRAVSVVSRAAAREEGRSPRRWGRGGGSWKERVETAERSDGKGTVRLVETGWAV